MDIKKFLPVFVLMLLFAPAIARADWTLTAEGNDEEIAVTVSLTPSDHINALSGKLSYPDSLKLLRFEDSGSLVSFWTVRPKEDRGAIIFEGVIPGGFQGVYLPGTDRRGPGPIFTARFARIKAEPSTLVIRGKVYLHDGLGTEKELPLTEITISSGSAISSPSQITADLVLPEPFSPELGTHPDLFEGDWFVSWNAYDKGSGIARYEILESRSGRSSGRTWQTASSPYRLRDQTLRSFIHLKAFDHAGNVRTVVLPPRVPPRWYDHIILQSILALVVITMLIRTIRKK